MATVFWSWQSDAPKRETRDLIQVALYAAVKDLAVEFEKAKRVSVDQDVKGVIGQALIAETILTKISQSSVFVGDITPVAEIGRGRNRKLIPNPNVMLEMGYARHALSMDRVIPVFNKAIRKARFEELPFDLRHLTGTIAYDLPVGASRPVLRKARTHLRKRFVEALRPMITESRGAAEDRQNAPVWHATLPYDVSIWEEAYNPLPVAIESMGQIDVIMKGGARLFVRILPASQGSAPRRFSGIFPGGESFFIPLGASGSLSGGRTGNGQAIFQSVGEDRTTKSILRWYKDNGEIWAISAWGFYMRDGHTHLAYDEMISDLTHWLERVVLSSQAAGGVGPFALQIGVCGLRQVEWWLSRPHPGAQPFRGLNDTTLFQGQIVKGDREEVLDLVDGFMNEVTDNFGVGGIPRARIAELATRG